MHDVKNMTKPRNKTSTVHFNLRGQITIPVWLRNDLEIEKGTRALVYQDGDVIILRPVTTRYIKSLRGSLKGSSVLKSLMDSRKRERILELG